MKIEELLLATNGRLLSDFGIKKFDKIFINGRLSTPGSVFIAIKGENFDGHDFINQAIKKGAKLAIVSNKEKSLPYVKKIAIIKVDDTLKALQDIAGYHRRKFNIPVIGITGSSGKTTTKDILASILSQELKTLKSQENLNNEIGVPLTLLRLKKSDQAAVIEMAMQKTGELDLLAKIVNPSIVIITNIGEAHLEYLKSRKNVAKAKSEILNYLGKDGTAILPADDKFVGFLKKRVPKKAKIILFGIEKIIKNEKYLKGIPLPGRHNVYNCLAAIKAAKILKIKDSSIIKGIKKFKPSSKRMEFVRRKDGITIINDTYNANPTSMKAALLTLASLKAKRRIALLGDMLELGKNSKKYHKEIGIFAKKLGIDLIISKGKLSKAIKGQNHFEDGKEALSHLKKIIRPGDLILIKGSRGMHLDNIVDNLRL